MRQMRQVLEGFSLLLRLEDLRFKLLEFLCDVALRLGQGLLPNPPFWHLVLVGISTSR